MSVPLLCLAVVVCSAVFGLFATSQAASAVLTENGPVETASVTLHLLVAAVAFMFWRRHGGPRRHHDLWA
ncbi:MAG: hypothetical protein K5831_00775 [Brevundimonas sp.]|uniref:hypothetical protein n=1 Tax=Brevundimonas sp. TaxID=1871086 RepID=UPI0025901871|nr:hypothetical protein [Brevundimonas sp.]MCV0413401.1 hypothetical protein [Brevundimonas sp.]